MDKLPYYNIEKIQTKRLIISNVIHLSWLVDITPLMEKKKILMKEEYRSFGVLTNLEYLRFWIFLKDKLYKFCYIWTMLTL